MMKFIFTFLAIFTSLTFSHDLKKNKIEEALEKDRLQQTKNIFSYHLFEDPFSRAKIAEMNKSKPGSAYGPFQLILKGIEPGTQFKVYQCNLVGLDDPQLLCKGYIDQNGVALGKRGNEDIKLSYFLQCTGEVLPGEPIYSIIVLNDETYMTAHVIPNPLEVLGKDGRHVTMEIFTLKEAKYWVQGENFKPEENITFVTCSQEGTETKNLKANSEGKFTMILEGDCKKGQQSIQVTTAEQTDPMIINFNWKFLKQKHKI